MPTINFISSAKPLRQSMLKKRLSVWPSVVLVLKFDPAFPWIKYHILFIVLPRYPGNIFAHLFQIQEECYFESQKMQIYLLRYKIVKIFLTESCLFHCNPERIFNKTPSYCTGNYTGRESKRISQYNSFRIVVERVAISFYLY